MKKLWGYIKSWFGAKTEQMKDPAIEIEQAIAEATQRDKDLRAQAAKVIAHRTQVQADLEDASAEVAEAKELAKQALMRADAAAKAGDAAAVEKWNTTAKSIALKLQAAQNQTDLLKKNFDLANQQADLAKEAVNRNAMSLSEISAKRMELLGKLEAAKMQESVNKAMSALNERVGDEAPSLEEVEDKIQARMAEASAKAEIAAEDPDVAIAELKQSTNEMKADAALEALRAELGMAAPAELPPAPA